MSEPCSCWQQVALHSGHCCFDGPDEWYEYGKTLPCGHTEGRK